MVGCWNGCASRLGAFPNWTHIAVIAVALCISNVLASQSVPELAGNVSSMEARRTLILRPSSFAVFGYLPEYRQKGFPYEAYFELGLTHLIFFSVEVDPLTSRLSHIEDRLPQGAEWRRIRRLATQDGVRLLVCVGGAGRSSGFAALVRDSARRQVFSEELNELVLRYELDGVDFNWEYPQSDAEWRDFGSLLRELRREVGYSVRSGTRRQRRVATPVHAQRQLLRSVQLSVALHPHPAIAGLLRHHGILPSVDYIHWMAYDDPSTHSSVDYARRVLQPAYIAQLDERAPFKRPMRTVGETITNDGAQHTASAPAGSASNGETEAPPDHRRKLTLGIPFYGRGTGGEAETYAQLVDRIRRTVRRWNSKDEMEMLRNINVYAGFRFCSYNDVVAKVRLAREVGPPGGLGGLMLWELGQDIQPPSQEPLSLMRAVQEGLRHGNGLSLGAPSSPSTPRERSDASMDDGTSGDL